MNENKFLKKQILFYIKFLREKQKVPGCEASLWLWSQFNKSGQESTCEIFWKAGQA